MSLANQFKQMAYCMAQVGAVNSHCLAPTGSFECVALRRMPAQLPHPACVSKRGCCRLCTLSSLAPPLLSSLAPPLPNLRGCNRDRTACNRWRRSRADTQTPTGCATQTWASTGVLRRRMLGTPAARTWVRRLLAQTSTGLERGRYVLAIRCASPKPPPSLPQLHAN